MDSSLLIQNLEQRTLKIRKDVIRELEIARSGHAASSLGLSEILTVLYFHTLRINPENPDWSERDLFVMSNGHCAPLLYAVLAERGFFPPEELATLRQFGSRLQGHPERTALPGLETTSGPLGSGLSQASGMAYYLRYLSAPSVRRVFCLMGDGELNEGNVWEAAMFAAKYRLSNLTAIVDRNRIQIGGDTESVMPLGDVAKKWQSFDWHTQEIDGHDISEIISAITEAGRQDGRPSVIIAHTVPGKGVDFMEGDYLWHGKAPTADEARRALAQLEVRA